MITKERLEQIGKSIMTNAVTATGFSPQFNKMRNIKSNIQIQITDQMSFDELQDVAISKKNNNVIEKLVTIGKKIYSQNPTDENAYMIAVSIGTIIKEYGWDNDYIAGEKLYVLVNKISQENIESDEYDNPEFQFKLGVKYANGEDVVQDYRKAAFWWEKAAQQGHATAQYNLAQCYEKELGVNIDYTLALYWYKKAAELGDDDALTNIALYHYLGRGTCQNYEEAIRLWMEAANLGNNKAAYNLGICYRDGVGVLKDLVEAEEWLVKAEDLGHPNASKALEQVQRSLKRQWGYTL